ncbi:MAG: hypothetical protein ACM3O9_04660 [Methylocystaceae bacterium]
MFGGFNNFAGAGIGFHNSFFCVLLSLLNFEVEVTTEGGNEERGLLVAVGRNFITLNDDGGGVVFIPICQITQIEREVRRNHRD